jgi:hypothetical protein
MASVGMEGGFYERSAAANLENERPTCTSIHFEALVLYDLERAEDEKGKLV